MANFTTLNIGGPRSYQEQPHLRPWEAGSGILSLYLSSSS
jgi:hypothetical protein